MPLYEYECRHCARQFEELVFGKAEPVCPACGRRDAKRILSVVSVGRSEPAASTSRAAPRAAGPCGSCGDPRGPGSCATN